MATARDHTLALVHLGRMQKSYQEAMKYITRLSPEGKVVGKKGAKAKNGVIVKKTRGRPKANVA